VIADVLALAQRQLAEHGIAVRTELSEDLKRVLGDRPTPAGLSQSDH
jgi:hypothetical protein